MLSGQDTVKSHFHSYQPELIQNNAPGALLQRAANHPKKLFRNLLLLLLPPLSLSLPICLPVCLVYLCLHLSYQFSSHSPCLLVITHHPLIERKRPVLSTTSKILSALNTCLQIFCPINDSCVFASDGGIHILVYLFSRL